MEETTRALIIVDVQPTFCEGGSLAVSGGNATAERIADFVTENASEYSLIATTQDWHIKPGTHFSATPDFVDTWPTHAVAGTPEAELHDAVASLPIDFSVKKGQYSAGYSGFDGTDESGDSLEDLLREGDIQAVDVVGIAESHCVKETALDSLRAGFPTRVLADLTVPVSPETGEDARQEMDEAGIEQIISSEAFGFYDESADLPGASEYDEYADEDTYADESDGAYEEDADAYEDDDFSGDYSVDEYSENSASTGSGPSIPGIPGLELTGGPSQTGDQFDASSDDYDLDDFEIDDSADFSDEISAEDMDFSEISFDPTKGF